MTNRTSVLRWLIRTFQFQSYLEIGLGDGCNFATISCPFKESVDPGGTADAQGMPTHQMTSDMFFAQNERTFDVVFIDGLHHAEAVERDIENSLACLNEGGVIVCHDMSPTTELMQRVPREAMEWTGDCWRSWLAVRARYPDMRMFVLDTDYGVGVIVPSLPALEGVDALDGVRVAEVSYEEFAQKKERWLPLVAPEAMAGLLAGLAAQGGGRIPAPPIRHRASNEGNSNMTTTVAQGGTGMSRLLALEPGYLLQLPKAERPFLLYAPVKGLPPMTDFTGPGRNYDVAYNDYTGQGLGMEGAEWQFAEVGHKWQCLARNLAKLPVAYEFYAFFDNDIEITVDDLNLLFEVGDSFGFDLLQCALTPDSHTAHPELKVIPTSLVRRATFVEIMMPVFSFEGLLKCVHTFPESESGWGLDCVWPHMVDQMGIVDMVTARHAGGVTSDTWQLQSGLTPEEEKQRIIRKYARPC